MIRLAWRNLWRNPRRSILTLLAIAFATAVVMFFMALQLRSYATAIRSTTSLFHGHLQVQAKGYLDRPQIRRSIDRPAEVLEKSSAATGVRSSSWRSFGFVMASSRERTFGAQVVGVDPGREPAVSTIPQKITEGRYLSSTEPFEGIVGATLASNLDVTPGDEVTLLGQGRDGSVAAGVVKVVGLFETGSKDLDRATLHVSLGTFDQLFTMEGQHHALVFRINDVDEVSAVQEEIAARLEARPELVVLRWDEVLPGLKQSILLDMSAGWLFFLSLILIVAFSVLNTVLMSILERQREFGVMLALGMKGPALSRLVLIEGCLLTLLGIGAGWLVGYSLVSYFEVVGFSIPGTEELMKLWHLPGIIYPTVTLPVGGVPPLVVLAFSIVAIAAPIIRVRSLRALDALRGG